MRIHLSLGSNLGDRIANLRDARDALDQLNGVCVTATSGCYETAPVGVTDQPAFLNAAVEIETDLDPLELLKAVKGIEQGLGRVPSERWGPRSIDIDIVLMGDRVMETQTLTVPHAEFRGRAFVLTPLTEIAADAVDPVTGATVGDLAARPEAQGAVRPADVRW
ncbi:MAG: 2-amino-4-hydroxy-6-hydroxymethyldihydropteridine diphosphokinase [bacterium]|nr:2-amino-4-hydroxy-6-hydroxymethyldihydropteridine diphosphokinase [bacterium]